MRWKKREMKISYSKTKYICVNEKEASGMVRLKEVEMEKVHKFKSTAQLFKVNCSGPMGECEVNQRVEAEWSGRRKMSGTIHDKRIAAKVNTHMQLKCRI